MKRKIAVTGLSATAILLGVVATPLALWGTGGGQSPRAEEHSRPRVARCRVLEVRETTINEATGDQAAGRPGLEYTIILADGSEPGVIQDFREGDRVITVGKTCRLLTWEDGQRRVTPAGN